MLPLWALCLSLILSRLLKSSADWRSLYVVCCLGLGIHIAGDVITSYGTMIFAPFSDWRASLDTAFIIDPFLSGIIMISLICSLIYKNRQKLAATGFVVLIFYLGLQTWAHHRAIQIGEQAANNNSWRETTISAMPQPLSPFHWKVIIEHQEHYHVTQLRLLGDKHHASNDDGFLSHLWAAYHPVSSLAWVRQDRYGVDRYQARLIKQAWQSDVVADFRRFARFPVLSTNGKFSRQCHWFSDLRFVIPGRKNTHLFTYGVCPSISPGKHFLQPMN